MSPLIIVAYKFVPSNADKCWTDRIDQIYSEYSCNTVSTSLSEFYWKCSSGTFFEERPVIMTGFVVSEHLYKSLLIVSYEECDV